MTIVCPGHRTDDDATRRPASDPFHLAVRSSVRWAACPIPSSDKARANPPAAHGRASHTAPSIDTPPTSPDTNRWRSARDHRQRPPTRRTKIGERPSRASRRRVCGVVPRHAATSSASTHGGDDRTADSGSTLALVRMQSKGTPDGSRRTVRCQARLSEIQQAVDDVAHRSGPYFREVSTVPHGPERTKRTPDSQRIRPFRTIVHPCDPLLHKTCKQQVVGSNPTSGSRNCRSEAMNQFLLMKVAHDLAHIAT